MKGLFCSLVGHQVVYDSDFAETVEALASGSTILIAESIYSDIHPNTAVDVGCGTGALLEVLQHKGCEVLGLDYSDACLSYCRARNLNVHKFDLETSDFDSNLRFDVAISMEVAEHLPAIMADRFVRLLTRLSNLIVFTAAPPGQGGTDHVNEQPPSYWISKFRDLGFDIDENMSDRWRQLWQDSGSVESWYHKNLMIFRRKDGIFL